MTTLRPPSRMILRMTGAGTDPDPAVYCVNLGYTPPEPDGTYTPPIDIGDPTADEEILLLVTNEQPSRIRLTATTYYTVELYDSNWSLLESVNVSTSNYYTKILAATENIELFIVRIIPRAGYHLTTFRMYNLDSSGYLTDYMRVLQAKFKTPYMTSLSGGFVYVKSIKEVTFHSTLDYMNSMTSFIAGSGVEKFTMPPSIGASAASLILSSFAEGSMIKTFDFNNCYLPTCTNMSAFFRSTQLKNLIINFDAPKLVGFSSFFYGVGRLAKVDLSTIKLVDTNSGIDMSQAFYFMGAVTEITLFDTHPDNVDLVTLFINYGIQGCPFLNKLIYKGKIRLTGFQVLNYLSPNIPYNFEYIEGSDVMVIDSLYALGQSLAQPKTVKLPNYIGSTGATQIFGNSPSYKIQNLIGQPLLYPGSALLNIDIESYYLTSFDQPNLRCSIFRCGYVNCSVLEYVEIDWANSFTDATHTSGQTILLLYGLLSEAELNRIYTALPTVTVLAKISTSYNTGYAASDKTIATSKGWAFV